MQSKHDILTAVIALAILAVTVILSITNHLSGGLETAFLTGLGMIFVYWFTRGGSLMSGNNVPTDNAQAIGQAIAQAAPAVIAAIGQQTATEPTQGGQHTNAGNVTGSGGN